MNGTLYKQGLKSNYKIFLVFCLILGLYISVIVYMFNPELGKTLEVFEKSMPQVMAMFGMNGAGATLTSFLSNYLYGFLLLVMPMIFEILAANRLVARLVDTGSMAYLLASPNGRGRVVRTQMSVLLTFVLLLAMFYTGVGLACSQVMFPGELDIPGFLRINLGAFLLHFAISGVCFFASCITNETRHSLLIGAGLSVLFYLIQMLANMGGDLEPLKYFTLFTLFDCTGLTAGDSAALWMLLPLAAIGLVLYSGGCLLFQKRDLPL